METAPRYNFQVTTREKKYYTEAANFLRSIGVSVSYKGNKTPTPQQKSAVTRYFNKYGGYKNERTQFIPLTRATKQGLYNVVSKQQITPKGVILVTPRGVDKKAFKYKVIGSGKTAYLQTQISSQRADKIVRLDPIKLAQDPVKAAVEAVSIIHPEAAQLRSSKLLKSLKEANKEVERVTKKKKGKRGKKVKLPVAIKVVVAGNEQRGSNEFATFFQYMSDLYLDPENKHGRKDNPISNEQFADLFHLKLIYTTQ